MKFRKKPVVIEAVQWNGSNSMEVARFIGLPMERIEANVANGFEPPAIFIIKTLEGDMLANVGDWIIRGVKGEFYPCKPDIFEATYALESAAVSEITVAQAMARISSALKEESGPGSYRDSWLANIAMPILDQPSLDLRTHEGASRMAEILLKHFFDA